MRFFTEALNMEYSSQGVTIQASGSKLQNRHLTIASYMKSDNNFTYYFC